MHLVIDHSYLANLLIHRAVGRQKPLDRDIWVALSKEYAQELYRLQLQFRNAKFHFVLDPTNSDYFRKRIMEDYFFNNSWWYTSSQGVIVMFDTQCWLLNYDEQGKFGIEKLKLKDIDWDDLEETSHIEIEEAAPLDYHKTLAIIVPEYKGGRPSVPVAGVDHISWKENRNELGRTLASFMGGHLYEPKNLWEADDVIYNLVNHLLKDSAQDIVVITGDSDLEQVRGLNPLRVHTYTKVPKGGWSASWSDNYPNKDWERLLAIKIAGGDTSDNIGGIFKEGGLTRVSTKGAQSLYDKRKLDFSEYYEPVVKRNTSLIKLHILKDLEKLVVTRSRAGLYPVELTWEDLGVSKEDQAKWAKMFPDISPVNDGGAVYE